MRLEQHPEFLMVTFHAHDALNSANPLAARASLAMRRLRACACERIHVGAQPIRCRRQLMLDPASCRNWHSIAAGVTVG
jgi:hypothetical protein